jgi:Regulator of chromosome condensation (RCC1) repeat
MKSDGTVWAWGGNNYGQLGDNSTTQRNVPVQVSGLSGVTAIAVGSAAFHSLALKSDGTVWAWGSNATGQIGNNSLTDSHVPVQVLSGVTAIAAGDSHSLAVKSGGTVWAWGYNGFGQLGNNSTTDSHVPVQVVGASGITAIAGGYGHSLALKSDATVWAWGMNGFGQLGNNSITESLVAVQVSGLSGVTAIAGAHYHSLALKSGGTVWAWGYNSNGQLGDTTTTFRKVPVQVSGLSSVTAIAGGDAHSLALVPDVATPTPTATATSIPTSTSTSTPTPTSTAIPTSTNTPTPTNTPVPPTSTATATAIPTSTPTATATPTACPSGSVCVLQHSGQSASLASTDTNQNLTLPVGLVGADTYFVQTLAASPAHALGSLTDAKHAFTVNGYLGSNTTGTPVHTFPVSYTMAVSYTLADVTAAGVPEANLDVYYWDTSASAWTQIAATTRDLVNHKITVSLNHLTDFALLGSSSGSGSGGGGGGGGIGDTPELPSAALLVASVLALAGLAGWQRVRRRSH